MSIYSFRDLPETTRDGIRLVVLRQFNISEAARRVGLTQKSLSLSVRKINAADDAIRNAYVLPDLIK
jgi:predicted DNA-binding protein (UPF0251 family)